MYFLRVTSDNHNNIKNDDDKAYARIMTSSWEVHIFWSLSETTYDCCTMLNINCSLFTKLTRFRGWPLIDYLISTRKRSRSSSIRIGWPRVQPFKQRTRNGHLFQLQGVYTGRCHRGAIIFHDGRSSSWYLGWES